MERLVNENGQVIFDGEHTEKELTEMAFGKLSLLEDIEQELGIDLITLFVVLKAKKVYHKKYGYYDNFSVDVQKAEIWFDNFEVKNGKPLHFEKLKDYGKTWSLHREALK